MSVFLGIVTGLLVLILVVALFIRLDPGSLARTLRNAGPVVLAILGLAAMLAGRAGIGGMMLSGALAWFMSNRMRSGRKKTPGKRSTVRTAALEMELDHDSGALEGVVLAGRYEARTLGGMALKELKQLYAELPGDPESRQLLETYLDSRFPVWREDPHTQQGEGLGVPPGTGAMTKQEAYKILGLEAGATAADIRKAHRRLMQRLHPDLGGSSFLAARINEAKDVLLTNQH
jgi:hypothetical protein